MDSEPRISHFIVSDRNANLKGLLFDHVTHPRRIELKKMSQMWCLKLILSVRLPARSRSLLIRPFHVTPFFPCARAIRLHFPRNISVKNNLGRLLSWRGNESGARERRDSRRSCGAEFGKEKRMVEQERARVRKRKREIRRWLSSLET